MPNLDNLTLTEAREALRLEASLERVRRAAMTMTDSSEILLVAKQLFAELASLDVKLRRVVLFRREGDYFREWFSPADGEEDLAELRVPADIDPIVARFARALETRQEIHEEWLEGDELAEHGQNLVELGLPWQPVERIHVTLFGAGLLVSSLEPMDPDAKRIASRFAQGFGLALQRSLDLETAERQARDAQIGASMERIRAAALAMRHSDEFLNVAEALWDELERLGVAEKQHAMIIESHREEGYFDGHFLVVDPAKPDVDPVRGRIRRATDRTIHVKDVYSQLDAGRTSITTVLEGQALSEFIDELVYEPLRPLYRSLGVERFYHNFAPYSGGFVTLGSLEPIPDETQQVLVRSAAAVDLAYRRHKDLQKAENQAQEAKIEAALERVRAAAMAMHSSQELITVVEVLREQLTGLGLEHVTGSAITIAEDDGMVTMWDYSSPGNHDEPDANRWVFDPVASPQMGEGWQLWSEGHEYFVQVFDPERIQLTLPEVAEVAPDYVATIKDAIEAGALQTQWIAAGSFSAGYLSVDLVQPPGEWAQPILTKMAGAFDVAWRRFKDLEKAEAQTREAQIEAAVERIRSKALAMHRSEDVYGVAVHLREEMIGLGINGVTAGSIFLQQPDGKYRMWDITTLEEIEAGDAHASDVLLDLTKIPKEVHLHEVLGFSGSYNVAHSGPEEGLITADWFGAHYNPTLGKELREAVESGALADIWFPAVPIEGGRMSLDLLEEPPPEMEQILPKFASAFELAYRRFEDLQQAEARAREAQIEAAVERVRGRALAMHRSEELMDVVVELRREFLGFGLADVSAATLYLEEGDDRIRMSDITAVEGSRSKAAVEMDLIVPLDSLRDQGWFQAIWMPGAGYRLNDMDLAQGLEVERWMRTVDPESADELKTLIESGELTHVWQAVTSLDRGQLVIEFPSEAPPAEMELILPKFATAFDLAYRRFEDLLQAEEQAREAQIEAAVERVRGRALAMHRSEELLDVVVELRREFLGFGLAHVSAATLYLEEGADHVRITDITNVERSDSGASLHMDLVVPLATLTDEPWFHAIWDPGPEFRQLELNLSQLYEVEAWLRTVDPSSADDFKAVLDAGDLPHLWQSVASLHRGRLVIEFVSEPPPNIQELVPRLAAAFDLAHQRFEDLRQAEVQAWEAKVEAALERVRAAAMAMHSTEDIAAASIILFDELNGLGITPLRSGISIPLDGDRYEFWAATKTEEGESTRVIGSESVNVHPIIRRAYDGWKMQEKYQTAVLEGEELLEYYHAVFDTMPLPDWQERMKAGAGAREDFATFPFSDGWLYLFNSAPLGDDELSTLLRFTQVFDLTYRRYLDLKQAEARALESRRDASVDRVRAEIASMRTAEDLERITPLVWRELETLDVPFERCGLFIMDVEAEITHVYLSHPDGSPIAAMEIPFSLPGLTTDAVRYWRERQVYTDLWNRKQLADWSQTMVEGGYVPEGYIPSLPDRLALHFVPFDQGVLYVGSEHPLAADQVGLIQALADAFSVAYARYDDFKRLEAAKAEVETTLTELRATQKQLVEQEKLASLGQLTAGIAHEIKNPLNFVNNFAEVSAELTQEAREALHSGDLDAARAALSDLEANSAQITKHGKRADEIVKAMMQHARGGDATRETVDLNHFVEEYVNLAWHGVRARRHGFTVDIERNYADDAGAVYLVPQEIGRVLVNLLNNAFDALSATTGATVAVSTERSSGLVQVRIADNGPGISKDVRERIFEPFFTTKATGEGTGLGLSLSYDIVTKGHGGKMSVRESPEGGAEFVIELPA